MAFAFLLRLMAFAAAASPLAPFLLNLVGPASSIDVPPPNAPAEAPKAFSVLTANESWQFIPVEGGYLWKPKGETRFREQSIRPRQLTLGPGYTVWNWTTPQRLNITLGLDSERQEAVISVTDSRARTEFGKGLIRAAVVEPETVAVEDIDWATSGRVDSPVGAGREYTLFLSGRSMQVQYGTARNSLIYIGSGPQQGYRERLEIRSFQIKPNVWMSTWREKDETVATVFLDFENLVAIANIVPKKGEATFARGLISKPDPIDPPSRLE